MESDLRIAVVAGSAGLFSAGGAPFVASATAGPSASSTGLATGLSVVVAFLFLPPRKLLSLAFRSESAFGAKEY
jgi:hypothetical protein